MVTFFIVLASLVGINALLLVFSNSLSSRKSHSTTRKKTRPSGSRVYPLSTPESEYRNAI